MLRYGCRHTDAAAAAPPCHSAAMLVFLPARLSAPFTYGTFPSSLPLSTPFITRYRHCYASF